MRRKKTRRQKNEELKRRFDAVKNLMSTFAMSTIAVVAVVTLVPASPKAEIIKTVALSDEIVYQVNVTDEDNALDLDTLTIVLENQLEYYEHPIILGENAGFFENLNINTQYRLSVYGDKGFGDERLDTEMITTREKVGSVILFVTPEVGHHDTIYQVDISTYDPDNLYSKIELVYGYKWEPDDELTYYRYEVTTDREMVEIIDIFTSYPIHMYIEGTTSDGIEVLDEIWVTPPFNLSSSLYLAYLNNTEVAFYAYGDIGVDDVVFTMNVYRGNYIIKTDSFTPSSDYHGDSKWVIKELLPNTEYLFECIATYTNPQTLRQEEIIIYSETHITMKDYSLTYNIETFDTYLEISITVNDPNNVFDYVFFETIDTSGEFDSFITSESYDLEIDGETKRITFTIEIPLVETYQINIGLRSYLDNNINQLIEPINKE